VISRFLTAFGSGTGFTQIVGPAPAGSAIGTGPAGSRSGPPDRT
jgi:hypothetical protein